MIIQSKNHGHERRPTTPFVAMLLPGLWLSAALTAVFWGTYAFFVTTRQGQRIDDAPLVGALHFMAAEARRRPALDFMDAMPAICAVLACVTLVLAAVRGRHLAPPLIATGSLAGAVVSTQLLKHWILDRPNLGISEATMNSFPSGHTTIAAASLFTVLLITPPTQRNWVVVFGGGFAAVAGAATLLLGWHRPSDVLAAYLVAALWAGLGAVALAVWSASAPDTTAHNSARAHSLGRLPGSLLVVGIVGAALGSMLWFSAGATGPVVGNEPRHLLVLAASLTVLLSMAMVLTVSLQWFMLRYRVDAGIRPGANAE